MRASARSTRLSCALEGLGGGGGGAGGSSSFLAARGLTGAGIPVIAPKPAGAGAADPIDKGNCLSSFVNGGAHGRQVSGDPGGAQASGELGQFLRETRGRC